MSDLQKRRDSGATSLFIVLFSTLLFSVITVGFISLMTSDQRRAADDEWSEGAYDSALAGVEDGKRVLALCRDNPGSKACDAIADVDKVPCNTIAEAGLVTLTDAEVLLQSVDGGGLAGESFNQAYSCVIINRETSDFKGELPINESVVIPLESGGKDFTQVVVSWFTREDSKTGATFGVVGDTSLPVLDPMSANWPATRPPIMRTQFMQYDKNSIDVNNFNQNGYAHTAFLYPSNVFGSTSVSFLADDFRNPDKLSDSSNKTAPKPVSCIPSIPEINGYACTVTIDLPVIPPAPATPIAPGNRAALIRLSALYGKTRYRVQMKSAVGQIVNFVGTQPSIDSTGRAGDVFRRVDARIDMTGASNNPYPRAAIDVTESLCKNFRLGVANTTWGCS